jgi:hypothetical protein
MLPCTAPSRQSVWPPMSGGRSFSRCKPLNPQTPPEAWLGCLGSGRSTAGACHTSRRAQAGPVGRRYGSTVPSRLQQALRPSGPDGLLLPATRRRLQHLPPVVTLHLKRFQQDWRGRLEKRDTRVPFALDLDLRPFLAAGCPAAAAEGALYELVGVVVHQGNMRGARRRCCCRCCCMLPTAPAARHFTRAKVRHARLSCWRRAGAHGGWARRWARAAPPPPPLLLP